MQIDMHYYATYAVARFAGLNHETAKTIAYADQYVDDSVKIEIGVHEHGYRLISVETAHKCDQLKNFNRNHQRYIWIPFHFIPGNGEQRQVLSGNEVQQSANERIVCQKGSKVVEEMFKHHLDMAKRPREQWKGFEIELLGIASHVFQDSYAHYGFSGVSSPMNKVVSSSIKVFDVTEKQKAELKKELKSFYYPPYKKKRHWLTAIWTDIKETAINIVTEFFSGALGHGPVGKYPDLPFLHWEYRYEPDLRSGKTDSQAKLH